MRIYSRFSDKCILKIAIFLFVTCFLTSLALCQYLGTKVELYQILSMSCLYSKDLDCLSGAVFNILNVKENILLIITIILSLNGLALGILISIIINSIRRK